ncbi:polyphosphate kinase 2 family protein [Tropicimonas sediminicola]|uniref:Polyphosphate:nucleotide phosphotransferase, PPK2 family n=1 Tax=Tropicimonas sediminicola TaxID=1031541 RepID=A0A239JUZ6_9RHOB|nr:polyphosphate kinase 2 family protein [Tropicimonas sediminicola]SNT09615.1 polyphosphate:nucleotide phosphotransferase, PPK2 family [Tropicimonas sediminicola]
MSLKASDLARRHRVDDGKSFRLDSVDPGDTNGVDVEKAEAKDLLEDCRKSLGRLQERLYAEGKSAVLMVFQAMDAGGKDSAIEHVMSGINPQGCDVTSFKQPGPVALKHDFLWRHAVALPERGRIGIHNRSHYEEVLVVRVHPEILEGRAIPQDTIDDAFWKRRFKDIRAFERHLSNSGTAVLKFFFHISKDEQARRFLDRIDEPEKNWKFSLGDIEERKHWDAYMAAYEDMIRNTARGYAPWFVVPANNKWYARLVVSSVLLDTLERIDPQFPQVDEDFLQRMHEARDALARDAAPAGGKEKDT